MTDFTSNSELVEKKAELTKLREEEKRLGAEIEAQERNRTPLSPTHKKVELPEGSGWLILIFLLVLNYQLDHFLLGNPEPEPFPGFGILESIVIMLVSLAVFEVYRWRKKNKSGE